MLKPGATLAAKLRDFCLADRTHLTEGHRVLKLSKFRINSVFFYQFYVEK